MADIVYCPICTTAFADTDDTGVCPFGHETRDLDEDDDWPVAEVTF